MPQNADKKKQFYLSKWHEWWPLAVFQQKSMTCGANFTSSIRLLPVLWCSDDPTHKTQSYGY